MLIHSELKKIFHQLIKDHLAYVDFNHTKIAIKIVRDASLFSLNATVYIGENFIPKSVRKALHSHPSFIDRQIKTNFSIEESQFKIYLNYLGHLDYKDEEAFTAIVQEFSWLLEEWRLYLDEHDKHDLIHLPIKR